MTPSNADIGDIWHCWYLSERLGASGKIMSRWGVNLTVERSLIYAISLPIMTLKSHLITLCHHLHHDYVQNDHRQWDHSYHHDHSHFIWSDKPPQQMIRLARMCLMAVAPRFNLERKNKSRQCQIFRLHRCISVQFWSGPLSWSSESSSGLPLSKHLTEDRRET